MRSEQGENVAAALCRRASDTVGDAENASTERGGYSCPIGKEANV